MRRHGLYLALAFAITVLVGDKAEAGNSKPHLESFGVRLTNAALAQRWIPAIYNPSYIKIPYPNGDVPWYFGVCTDVVVRAYRELGIDLQKRVHLSRLGSGDRNIDHRRVTVQKRFFAKYGKRLPTSRDPARYKPGDLVTYYVPDGQFSKTHIAIVTQYKSTSGVPMVVHNRGYGVQLEDWLFGSVITGHYRFSG